MDPRDRAKGEPEKAPDDKVKHLLKALAARKGVPTRLDQLSVADDPFTLAKALESGHVEIGRPEYCTTAWAREELQHNGTKKLMVGPPFSEVRLDGTWSWTDLRHPKSKSVFEVLEEDRGEEDPRIKLHARLTSRGLAAVA